MLPYETYVNPNFHIRYEIGYSPSNHTIVIVRRLENRSNVEDWDADEETLSLEWYLIKKQEAKKMKYYCLSHNSFHQIWT